MDVNDLKILELLDKNSRLPYDIIGKTINLTGNAVRSRVVQMINDKVIEKFVFKIQSEIFGIKTSYVKFYYPKKTNMTEIIEQRIGSDLRYSEIITGIDGEIVIKVNDLGSTNLQIAIEELKKKLNDFQFGFIIQRYFPSIKKPQINNSLLKVMSYLIDDVRISVADLARKCKMTSKSIKYYLEEIIQLKIGRFSVNYQPNKISKRIFVNFFISKPNLDYINFSHLYNSLKSSLDLKSVVFKDYLLVNPPGIFCEITVESLEKIDQIEQEIIAFLKNNYEIFKMFPSKVIFRESLVNKLIRNKIASLESAAY